MLNGEIELKKNVNPSNKQIKMESNQINKVQKQLEQRLVS